MNGTEMNGSDSRIADVLQQEATVGYVPTLPLETLWLSGGDMPQITLRRDLEYMRTHPIVMIAMEYYKSGIAGAEFWGGPDQANPDNDKGKPISPDPKVAQFVLAHVEKFWDIAVPLLQEGGYHYGWAPGEHIYREYEGMIVWSHLKAFHPSDAFMLTCQHEPIGIRVKNVREKEPVDLWLSCNVPSKACWYAHRSRFGSWYGRSQMLGAWRPWRRLGYRDGVEQVIDAAVYRAGYKGPIVRHPPGHSAATARSGVPATQADEQGRRRREYRDVARQLVEWAKAGAGFTLSSEQYPESQGGGKKWDIEWPDHVMDVSPLVNAAKYLEDQIMLGIGVPPELIKAAETGSGYSGRSVPREAFLDGQQKIANAMLQMFVEHVVKPLVLWNFGDVPFAIHCKPLLKTQSDDKQGEQQKQQEQEQSGQDQQPPDYNQPPDQRQPQQAQPPAAMSLDRMLRVKTILKKVCRKVSQ